MTGVQTCALPISDDWEPRPQLLFRSTQFGDDVDRPLQKSDGSWTYFAADIAYHLDKVERGFNRQIDVWGADHGGYVKRMQAAVNAVSGGKASLEVKLCQLVNLLERGEPVKMSKRAGTFVTLRDVIDRLGAGSWAGAGAGIVRFIMLTRKTLLTSVAALAGLAATGPAFAQSGPIKIGELNSYKVFPAFLEPYKMGMELARTEINASGGILGRPLEIVIRDDGTVAGRPSPNDHCAMIANFALATFMVGLTVTIHFGGLLGLLWLLRGSGHRFRPHESAAGQGAVILIIVLGLVGIHTVEVWLYALAYIGVGEIGRAHV